MTITLPPELEQYVQDQVRNGRYLSPDQMVGEALRLLEERDYLRQRRLETLRREIAIGVEQADRGELLDGEEVFRELEAKYADRPEAPP